MAAVRFKVVIKRKPSRGQANITKFYMEDIMHIMYFETLKNEGKKDLTCKIVNFWI